MQSREVMMRLAKSRHNLLFDIQLFFSVTQLADLDN